MSLNILDTPSLIDGFQQASLSEDESTDWSTVPTNDSDDSLTSWHTVETEEEDALDGPFENEFDGLMYLLERNDEQGVRNFFFKNHTHYSPHILSTELEDLGPPLTYAAERGQVSIVRTLIQEGADVLQKSNTTDFALPISCMDKGRDDVSMFLLQDCGADINSTDDEELLNAAMMALLYKRSGLFWQLVTRPAINMRHVDNEGHNLLHCAVIGGHYSCAKRLLVHPGIDVNQQSMNGETPLLAALRVPKRKKFVMLLLEHPLVDVNIPNQSGLTPLMVACKKEMTTIVHKLATREGVDLHAECQCGHTAYDLVKRKKNSQRVVEILKSVGAHLRDSEIVYEDS